MRKRRREIRSAFLFPVCQRANTVNVSSVPQSVPPGTPRKPIQGLAVPQFHDFGRIGEKNTKNRSAHIPGKRAPARPAPQAPCAPRPERRTTGSAVGGEPARKARVAPRVRSRTEGGWPGAAGGSGDGRKDSQKEEKLRFFSPIPADFRRIYCEAGISLAVTSARNSGQRGRKTALLRGFGSS